METTTKLYICKKTWSNAISPGCTIFPRWGSGGCCKPPSGVRGGALEANAYWQQSTENFVLLYNFIIIYLYNIGAQNSWFFLEVYITKQKIGHSFRRLGNPPSEGPKLVIITHPRDYRATASSVQMSHFPPKKIIEHSTKNTKQ